MLRKFKIPEDNTECIINLNNMLSAWQAEPGVIELHMMDGAVIPVEGKIDDLLPLVYVSDSFN